MKNYDFLLSGPASRGLVTQHPLSDNMWDIIAHNVQVFEANTYEKYAKFVDKISSSKVYTAAKDIKQKIKSKLPEFNDLEHMLINGFGASFFANIAVSTAIDTAGMGNGEKNELSYLTEFIVYNYTVGKEFFFDARKRGLTIRQTIGDAFYLVALSTLANIYVYKTLRADVTNILTEKVGMSYTTASGTSQVGVFPAYAIALDLGMKGVYKFQEKVAQIDEYTHFSDTVNAWGRVIDGKLGIREKINNVKEQTIKLTEGTSNKIKTYFKKIPDKQEISLPESEKKSLLTVHSYIIQNYLDNY